MNWKNVIADIQRHGQMTQPQIAKAVGCSQTTVSELALLDSVQAKNSEVA